MSRVLPILFNMEMVRAILDRKKITPAHSGRSMHMDIGDHQETDL